MRLAGWILFLSTLVLLAATLARLSAAGRVYREGRMEEAERRARRMGSLSLSLGVGVLATGSGVAGSSPAHPLLGWAGLCLMVLASIAGGLGGLSRKPVPSVHVAWALLGGGSVALAAAILL